MGQMFYGYGEHVLMGIIAYNCKKMITVQCVALWGCIKMNRDKIGTQTCYIHQCTKRYVDVYSMSVSQSCLCSFFMQSLYPLQIS